MHTCNGFITVFVLEMFLLGTDATVFRFLSSCDTTGYFDAVEKCQERNATLFNVNDLVLPGSVTIVDKAIEEHQINWINKTKDQNCYVFLKKQSRNAFEKRDCKMHLHYVCRIISDDGRDIPFNESYIPCQVQNKGETAPSSAGESGTNSSLTSYRLSTTAIVVIGVCVAIPILLIVFSTTIYCITSRHYKPKRYAVREESAKYHRNNPKPDTDVKDTKSEITEKMSTKGFVIGAEIQTKANNEEYDILWKTSTDELKVKGEGSGTTGVYGHLVRNTSKNNDEDGNVYDTTASPDFDTRPVDNPYARTYMTYVPA